MQPACQGVEASGEIVVVGFDGLVLGLEDLLKQNDTLVRILPLQPDEEGGHLDSATVR